MRMKRGTVINVITPKWGKGIRYIKLCKHIEFKAEEIESEEEYLLYRMIKIKCNICNVVHKVNLLKFE